MSITQLLLTIPIMIINREYYITGFKTLLKRSPNMDSLIAVGTTAAFIYGIIVIYMLAYGFGHNQPHIISHYSHSLYFESIGVILTLITLGKFFEAKSKGKTSEAIQKLISLAPDTAILLDNGLEKIVPTESLKIGDILAIKPGSKIPTDGIIIKGLTSTDESMITGESLPVEKQIDDYVIGSSINKTGYCEIRVTEVGDNTVISKIIQLIEDAQATKPPIVKLADQISRYFVPTVLGISVITFIIWLTLGFSVSFSLTNAIAVLIISCPCALGLATPTAIMVASGKSAEYGILIKQGAALETLHKIDTIVLDKTGTITHGNPNVTDIVALSELHEQDIISLVASAEKASEHPLGDAIVEYARNKNYELFEVDYFEAVSGQGLLADTNGHLLHIGNKKLMENYNISLNNYLSIAEELSVQGKTPLFVSIDKQITGIIALRDEIKPESIEGIKSLQANNLDIIMLTGDHKNTAKAIGEILGITHVIAEVLPGDKASTIKELQEKHKKVAMVGDGINDAPALTQADIGIAISSGTDIAVEAGDIILMKDNLQDIDTAIRLSHKTIKIVKENLFWAFFYNVLFIPVAAGLLYFPIGILLNPMFAAAAMSFSSVTVVLNALRLRNFKSKHGKLQSVSENECNEEKCPINNVHPSSDEIIVTLNVNNMSCSKCVKRVTDTISNIDGTSNIKVSLENKSATFIANNEAVIDAVINSLSSANYPSDLKSKNII
jgi:Cu+-exporting ATPase